MSTQLESSVRNEVEALHKFFVGWFAGDLPMGVLETEFLPRFDRDFHLISPTGSILTLADLQTALQRSHATNPGLRIVVRNVKVHQILSGLIVATYEEWQRGAQDPMFANSARISTVVLDQTRSLRWLHVHESWLPAEVASAGPGLD